MKFKYYGFEFREGAVIFSKTLDECRTDCIECRIDDRKNNAELGEPEKPIAPMPIYEFTITPPDEDGLLELLNSMDEACDVALKNCGIEKRFIEMVAD